jgi:hypothetical protein
MLPFGVGIIGRVAAWAVFGSRRQNAPITRKQFADMEVSYVRDPLTN